MTRIVDVFEHQELMRDAGVPTYEPIATTTRKSRKDRACGYGDTIRKGERYERHVCKYDGQVCAIDAHLGGGACLDYGQDELDAVLRAVEEENAQVIGAQEIPST